MPDVPVSVGAGLDYATITLFEAGRTNANFGTANTTVIGECNAEVFDEDVTFAGAESNIVFTHLTAEAAERHGGLEGVGARLVNGGTGARIVMNDTMRVSWLELDGNGAETQLSTLGTTFGTSQQADHNIIHGDRRSSTAIIRVVDAGGRDLLFFRNIVYDHVNSAGGSGQYWGVSLDSDLASGGCFNNTVDNIQKTGGTSGDVAGIHIATNDADARVYNNYAGRISGGTGGVAAFQWPASTTLINAGNNADDDATANVGTGNVNSIIPADQFVSLTGGAENYHIKAGSDLIDVGLDLIDSGQNVTDNEIDIDETTLTGASLWDIGVHDLIAAAANDDDPYMIPGGSQQPLFSLPKVVGY